MSSYLGGTSSGLGQALAAMSPQEQKDFAASMGETLIDFTPVVSEAKSFAEGEQARQQGDYLMAGLGYAGAVGYAASDDE